MVKKNAIRVLDMKLSSGEWCLALLSGVLTRDYRLILSYFETKLLLNQRIEIQSNQPIQPNKPIPLDR